MKNEKGREKWRPRPVEVGAVRDLARRHGLALPIAAILWQRGVGEGEVAGFLRPGLGQLPDPSAMRGMAQAASLLADAVQRSRPITVYGDYDADGVTAAAVLVRFFQALGVGIDVVQPDRFTHGYGLHPDLVRRIGEGRGRGGVLVTVDCGISDREAVALARSLGLEVIVTDHHQPPADLPPASVILNPLQPGCAFPEKHLAGVGIAFYLAAGVRRELRQRNSGFAGPNLKELLDLVAVGTVADMVPLTGANRILARVGLEVLRHTRRPGLAALVRACGLEPGAPVTADDIAFRLGPRLNAAGRMDSARAALDLLVCDRGEEADRLAAALDAHNQDRRQTTEAVVAEAAGQAGDPSAGVVVAGAGWHQGVLGIVASRLVERFGRPAVVLALPEDEGEPARGSARSVPGFNLYQALAACRDLLLRFGGHEQAAGLALAAERIGEFRARFQELVRAAGLGKQTVLEVDLVLDGREIGRPGFLDQYRLLAPFGVGNPEPLFASCGVRFADTTVLRDRHLRCRWQAGGRSLVCIGFGQAHLYEQAAAGPADMLFHLRPNYWQGSERWQAHIMGLFPQPSS